MTKEEQREKLYIDVKNSCENLGYTIVSAKEVFINNQSVIEYICPIHGLQSKRATGLKQGKKCALCANMDKWKNAVKARAKEHTSDKYYQIASKICRDKGYTIISPVEDFRGYKSYIRYSCPSHGEQTMRFGNLYNGRSCPQCNREKASDRFRLPIDDVIYKVEQCGGKLLNSEDYLNNTYPNLKIQCARCHKNIIETSLRHFIQHGGKVCHDCYKKESNGERIVREWLESNNIDYEQQKWFKDCRDNNPLPFDFFIPSCNVAIEFDGKQHFDDNHYFNYTGKKFNSILSYIQYHDSIKTNYCRDNNIELIRIPYYSIDKIDSILSDFLRIKCENIVSTHVKA